MSGGNVSARVVSATDYTIKIGYTPNSNAIAGRHTVTCYWSLGPYTNNVEASSPPLDVYDATPRIDSVFPSQFEASPAEQVINIDGAGFGTQPPTLRYSAGTVHTRILSYSPTRIIAGFIANVPGDYTVTVVSNGTTGTFQAGGGLGVGATRPNSECCNKATYN